MKKIHLNKDVTERDGTFQVYIANKFYHFTSRRKADDFIRAVDNYLNAQFELINSNLISIYGTYRRLSWYLTSYDRQAMRLQINDVEQSIELSIERSEWSSWRVTTFSKLDYSIELLSAICERMAEISKQKKYIVLSSEIRSNLKSIDMLKLQCQRFDVKNKKYLREPFKKIIKMKNISNL